jgi:hypothetical protein
MLPQISYQDIRLIVVELELTKDELQCLDILKFNQNRREFTGRFNILFYQVLLVLESLAYLRHLPFPLSFVHHQIGNTHRLKRRCFIIAQGQRLQNPVDALFR